MDLLKYRKILEWPRWQQMSQRHKIQVLSSISAISATMVALTIGWGRHGF